MAEEEAEEIISVNIEGIDLISLLPDALLSYIISFLPGTESVRTCVLSKQWKMVWKLASHLSVDQRHVLKPLIQAYFREVNIKTRLEIAINRRWVDDHHRDDDRGDEICETEVMMESLFDSHEGTLKSCTIRHLPESCASGKVVTWMRNLLRNKVKELSMERDDTVFWKVKDLPELLMYYGMTLELPFEIFVGFEALELKNYTLQTLPTRHVFGDVLRTLTLKNMSVGKHVWEGILSCCLCLENLTVDNVELTVNNEKMSKVRIDSRRIKFFKICRMVMNEIEVSAINLGVFEIDAVVMPRKLTLKIPKVLVLRSCCGIKNREKYICWLGSKLLQSRKTLHTLCIDFAWKTVENSMTLFSALKSCPRLQTLEINSKVNHDEAPHDYNEHDEDAVRYCFNRMEPCDCINHHLKTLTIKGYSGTKFEVEFLKYIITRGEVMKKITICFVDDCSWVRAAETGCLLSFRKASPKLSIILKPGPLYMAYVDGNFETWLSTLRE